jgi:hypothetical protein
MVRGKSSVEVREMFNISYDPPGEGLNAVNNNEGAAAADVVPTVSDVKTVDSSSTSDPSLNQ